MSQSKFDSFLESATNTMTGYVITMITGMVVYPLFGIHVSFQTLNGIVLWFTAVSVARGYFFRRMFNGMSPGAAFLRKIGR